MAKVCIIGTGNVSWHFEHLLSFRHEIVQIVTRSPDKKSSFNNIPLVSYDQISRECDMYILCVSDDVIEQVAHQISTFIAPTAFVVHTSGTKSVTTLKAINARLGVMWPIQSLRMHSLVDRNDIPFGITSTTDNDLKDLVHFVESVCPQVYKIEDHEKPHYHLMSVWLNNFINHMIYYSEKYCEEHELDSQIFGKLIKQTILKHKHANAFDTQTGPARRHDQSTMDRHLEMLDGHENMQAIYKLFSKSIMDTYPLKTK
jgi:predicted short-subunit dehydrogenase-like oxidoreductase (DUF2520 family)